jgi:hypothetical protein
MVTFEDVIRMRLKKVRPTRRLKLRNLGRIPRHMLEQQIDQMEELENAMTQYQYRTEIF